MSLQIIHQDSGNSIFKTKICFNTYLSKAFYIWLYPKFLPSPFSPIFWRINNHISCKIRRGTGNAGEYNGNQNVSRDSLLKGTAQVQGGRRGRSKQSKNSLIITHLWIDYVSQKPIFLKNNKNPNLHFIPYLPSNLLLHESDSKTHSKATKENELHLLCFQQNTQLSLLMKKKLRTH